MFFNVFTIITGIYLPISLKQSFTVTTPRLNHSINIDSGCSHTAVTTVVVIFQGKRKSSRSSFIRIRHVMADWTWHLTDNDARPLSRSTCAQHVRNISLTCFYRTCPCNNEMHGRQLHVISLRLFGAREYLENAHSYQLWRVKRDVGYNTYIANFLFQDEGLLKK